MSRHEREGLNESAKALSTPAVPASPATRSSTRLLAAGDPVRVLVGYFQFGTLQLLLSLFALVQAGRWSADDQAGRLEMVLSAPVSRPRVVADRGLALTAGVAVIAVAGTTAGWLGARNQALSLTPGDLAFMPVNCRYAE